LTPRAQGKIEGLAEADDVRHALAVGDADAKQGVAIFFNKNIRWVAYGVTKGLQRNFHRVVPMTVSHAKQGGPFVGILVAEVDARNFNFRTLSLGISYLRNFSAHLGPMIFFYPMSRHVKFP
jgi:hypothetical protein